MYVCMTFFLDCSPGSTRKHPFCRLINVHRDRETSAITVRLCLKNKRQQEAESYTKRRRLCCLTIRREESWRTSVEPTGAVGSHKPVKPVVCMLGLSDYMYFIILYIIILYNHTTRVVMPTQRSLLLGKRCINRRMTRPWVGQGSCTPFCSSTPGPFVSSLVGFVCVCVRLALNANGSCLFGCQ